MIYVVKKIYTHEFVSIHLTRKSAVNSMYKNLGSYIDSKDTVAFLYGIGAILCFAGIGVLLAWRG
jgi:hypothetical protein